MPSKDFDYSKAISMYRSLLNERSEWEQEYRSISEYLLPGRGVYSQLSKPRKRKLTTPKVINTVGEDALYVLTSGMHGALTSPSRPWFKLEWSDDNLKGHEHLKAWLQDCEKRLHNALHASNFYSIINSFYVEYAGFGTGCMYVGEDTFNSDIPFRFELMTAGEYLFSMGADQLPNMFMRVIFMTPQQLVERFPDTASKEMKKQVKDYQSGTERKYITVLETVRKYKYQDKPWERRFYEVQTSGVHGSPAQGGTQEPLEVSGFYEFPYPLARWGTIGQDVYGIGPGSRSLPDIKRVQEMEKAFLMATHKSINPPLNAPARMRGKLNTLPGGYNYYSNPQETVNEVYQVNFDYQGVGGAIERVEQRVQRNFFNDVFLTAARDPNASPLRTGQVNAQEQEKLLRLGPVVERLQSEFYVPVISRCFNIMLRKDMMAPLSPELAQLAGEYDVTLVSPLATAQRSVALTGINSFMGFVANAAQFNPTIMDNLDVDKAAREYADITGVNLGVLRPMEDVQRMRQERAEAEAQKQAREEAAAMGQLQSQTQLQGAQERKTSAEAALTQMEANQVAIESGLGI